MGSNVPPTPSEKKHQLALWIEIWLIASGIICAADISFTMLRPLTNKGGSMEKLYHLWNIYAEVDLRYARTNDVVTMASGRIMLLEIFLNFVAVFLNRKNSKHTLILTFSTTLMVFWKTVFYATLYIRVPEGNIDYINPNATFWQLFWIFIIPTCVWIFIPLAILIWLWPKLTKEQGTENLVKYQHNSDSLLTSKP